MKSIASSELIINSDGSIFHLHLRPEELADRVILVGDPGRVALVSSFFDKIEFERANREFVSTTGSYKGKRITVLSTGIGTDNIDIVVNELDALANICFETRKPKEEHRTLTLLRIGTSGALQPDIALGSFLFSTYSIGVDGLLNWYSGRERVTDVEMEQAFIEQTGWLPHLPTPYFAKGSERLFSLFKEESVGGMTVSAPGFYAPQGRVLRLPLAMSNMLERLESFRFGEMRIVNFEMEGSAISGLATLLGHEAATLSLVIANRHLKESNPDYAPLMDSLIQLSLEKL